MKKMFLFLFLFYKLFVLKRLHDCTFGCVKSDTSYLSVFSPNAGRYGPEKTPYLDTFHTVLTIIEQKSKS